MERVTLASAVHRQKGRVDLRVHSHTADFRPPAQPATSSSFTQAAQLPIRVARLADRSAAVLQDVPNFSAHQADLGVSAFVVVSYDLGVGAGRAAEHCGSVRAERDAVDDGSAGDQAEREDVSWFEREGAENAEGERRVGGRRVGLGAGHDRRV